MANWYYARGDEQVGPVEASEIDALITQGTLDAQTMVWKAGMGDWQPASLHFEVPGAPPPPLPGAAPASDPDIGPDGLYVGAPSREFIEAAKVCLSKYATFSGRASRSEFWFFYLFMYLVMMVAQAVDFAIIVGFLLMEVPFIFPIFTILAVFGLLLPQLSSAVRRLHDINRTGWWLGGGILASGLFFGAIIAAAIVLDGPDMANGEPPEMLLALLPIYVLGIMIYTIMIFIFYVTKGTLGPNRFG